MRKGVTYTIIGGLFLLLILPFIFTPGLFFPYITGKAFLFRFVVEILFAAWVVGALFHKQLRPTKSSILYAFTGFMAVFLIANIFGANPYNSFWSNFERMEGYITYIHLFMLFLTASSVVKDKKIWGYIFKTTIALSIVISLHAIIQYLDALEAGKYVRSAALFGNPIYLAAHMVFTIFLSLFYARQAGNWMKSYYGAVIVLNFIAIIFTGTRGAAVGLLVGALVTLALVSLLGKSESSYRKLAAGTLGLIVLVGALFFTFKNADFIQENRTLSRFANTSLTEKTAEARFVNWGIAWEGFKERPVLGWGQSNYNYIFDSRFDADVLYNQEQWFDHVHNIVLDMLVTGGIFGFIAYLLLFVTLLYIVWKDRELMVTEKSILTGLMAAYLVQNLFAFDSLVSYMYFTLILAYVHGTNATDHMFGEKEVRENSRNILIANVVAVLLVVGVAYSVNYKAYATNVTLIDAMRWVVQDQNGNTVIRYEDGGLASFQKAYGYNSFGNAEVIQQILNGANMVQRYPRLSDEGKKEFVDFAKQSAEEVIARDPENSRLRYVYGGFLANAGLFGEAEVHLAKTVELSPTRPSTGDLLTQVYLSTNRFEEARAHAKKMYELAPLFDPAWYSYAISLYASGNIEEYDALILEARTELPEDEETPPEFRLNNRLDRLEAHYRQMNSVDGDNYIWKFLLAEVLVNRQNVQNALQVIEEGKSVHPEHAGEFSRLEARIAEAISNLQSETES